MGYFETYWILGLEHITDLNGYDHILFVMALSLLYTWQEWKKLLGLITAFTLGHSLTLALATLKIIQINSNLIEFLIPLTILITSLLSLFFYTNSQKNFSFRYILAASFGLIHGLGFSNFLQSLLGKEASIFEPLLAFNLGLEIGQLAIVGIVLGIGTLLNLLKIKQKWWQTTALILIAIFAGQLIFEKWIF